MSSETAEKTKALIDAERRVEELQKRLAQAQARKAQAEARARHKAKKAERARDTRRKVIVGAIVLKYASKDEKLAAWLQRALKAELKTDRDRDLFAR